MSVARRHRHNTFVSINAKVARTINRSIILNLIRERQPISRARIATESRLNKSTVSSIVAALMEEQLIAGEIDRTQSVGRNPISLRLKTGTHFVGALYFDSASTRIAVVDIDGSITHAAEIPSEVGHPSTFVARCLDTLDELRAKTRTKRLFGVGITVAGIVDSSRARVLYAPNLGWENMDLGSLVLSLRPELKRVAVENDAKASALAEQWFGKNDVNPSNFVFLSVGRGIGTGIVIERRILAGDSHAAGEFGHMVLIEGGEPCTCGNKGCWEAYASDRATVKAYLSAAQTNGKRAPAPALEDIIALARSGDGIAYATLMQLGRYLGMGIASIIKAVDPSAIILGGRVANAWDIVYPALLDAVTARGFFGNRRATTILPTSLPERPPLLGAAALVVKQLFQDARAGTQEDDDHVG